MYSFFIFTFSECSPKKYNGVNKPGDDEPPSIKKTFEMSENITNNVERYKKPRVSCIYSILSMPLKR